MAINFFNEDSSYKLTDSRKRKAWIKGVINSYEFKVGELNYIFCSDEHLKSVNIDYLNHDYYTDIITFDNSEQDGLIEGDIFISTDRISDNAQMLHIPFETELNRVLIHGVLHLIGFDDHAEADKIIMREKEDKALFSYL